MLSILWDTIIPNVLSVFWNITIPNALPVLWNITLQNVLFVLWNTTLQNALYVLWTTTLKNALSALWITTLKNVLCYVKTLRELKETAFCINLFNCLQNFSYLVSKDLQLNCPIKWQYDIFFRLKLNFFLPTLWKKKCHYGYLTY